MLTAFDAMMVDLRKRFEQARLDIQQQAERAIMDLQDQAEVHKARLDLALGARPPLPEIKPFTPVSEQVLPPATSPGKGLEAQKVFIIEHALERASDMVGYPYKFGGGDKDGPTVGIVKGEQTPGFDCSGLVVYAYGDTKFYIPRTTVEQYSVFERVDPGDLRPGVLAYSAFDNYGNPGHVSIITDERNQCLEAGDPVGFYNFVDRGRVEYRIPRI